MGGRKGGIGRISLPIEGKFGLITGLYTPSLHPDAYIAPSIGSFGKNADWQLRDRNPRNDPMGLGGVLATASLGGAKPD